MISFPQQQKGKNLFMCDLQERNVKVNEVQ